MKCEELTQWLYDDASFSERVLLWLHLLRCRHCREEAERIRAVKDILRDLPRHSPPASLLPRLLAIPQKTTVAADPGAAIASMRKVSFGLALVSVIILLLIGAVFHPSRVTEPSHLTGVAVALQEAQTIHVIGKGTIGGRVGDRELPPWGELDKGHFEMWVSPEGYRYDIYDAAGELEISTTANIKYGLLWTFNRLYHNCPNGLVSLYPLQREHLEGLVRRRRDHFLEATTIKHLIANNRREVTSRTGLWRGREVTVMEVAQWTGVPRTHAGSTEFYLDAATGRLVGSRSLGPESHGKPLVGILQKVEYDIALPSDTFAYKPPQEAAILEGYSQIMENGGIHRLGPLAFRDADIIHPDSTWHLSASHRAAGQSLEDAIDEDITTRWVGRGDQEAQTPGMWFQIEFDRPRQVTLMEIDHRREMYTPDSGWPRGLQVSITKDGKVWQKVPTFQADADSLALAYLGSRRNPPAVKAIRLTLTETSAQDPWAISGIWINGPFSGYM